MKRFFIFAFVCLLALLIIPCRAAAQATHTVTLSWTLSTDDTTAACTAAANCSQNVYRATGACSSSSVFTVISSPSATAVGYSDSAVTVGAYCYQVAFVINGVESAPSNQVTARILPTSPTSLALQIK